MTAFSTPRRLAGIKVRIGWDTFWGTFGVIAIYVTVLGLLAVSN